MVNNVDISIGSKIRNRRHILGMSQSDLADKIGVTFQQIQKYEKGQNKVMASRLFDLSQIMDTNINYFFEDCLNPPDAKADSTALQEEQADFIYDGEGSDTIEKESIKLLKIYNKIRNKDAKKKLLLFLKSLAE